MTTVQSLNMHGTHVRTRTRDSMDTVPCFLIFTKYVASLVWACPPATPPARPPASCVCSRSCRQSADDAKYKPRTAGAPIPKTADALQNGGLLIGPQPADTSRATAQHVERNVWSAELGAQTGPHRRRSSRQQGRKVQHDVFQFPMISVWAFYDHPALCPPWKRKRMTQRGRGSGHQGG